MKLRTSRWIIAICVAAIVHIAIFWGVTLLDFSFAPATDQAANQGNIEYVSVDQIEEEMTLFDPRPLLLPTRWNFANTEVLEDRIQEEPIFKDYAPAYGAEDGNFVYRYGNQWSIKDSPREYLTSFELNRFAKLRRREPKLTRVEESSLHVLVKNPASGRVLYSDAKPLYNNAAQEISEEWPGWEPATFLVTVMDSFFLSQGSIVQSSGFAEVDQRLSSLISGGLLIGTAVPDGAYFVEIGP